MNPYEKTQAVASAIVELGRHHWAPDVTAMVMLNMLRTAARSGDLDLSIEGLDRLYDFVLKAVAGAREAA